jgi:formylglycine-generating enzyme required for sulfatase activity
MKKVLVLFAVLLLVSTSSLFAQSRGLSVVTADGKQVAQFGEARALVIGESAYTNGWAKLGSVKEDVVAVKKLFEQQGFIVETLEDKPYNELKSGIENFLNKYGHIEDARLIIYFAGHGCTLILPAGNEMGYVVSVDTPLPAVNRTGFLQRAIPMQQFDAWSKQYSCRHILFMFDSCFAGSIFTTRSTPAMPPAISAYISRPVRQFITAGAKDEEVPYTSVFRPLLERALRDSEADLNKDGYVTGTELGMYLQTEVVNRSQGKWHPQYGKSLDVNLDGGEFIFAVSSRPVQPERTGQQPPTTAASTQRPLPPNFVRVEGGTFQMGSNSGDSDEKPVHSVTVKTFHISKYQVTQKEWREVMGTTVRQQRDIANKEWKLYGEGDNYPMYYVSWREAVEFCNKLSIKERLTPAYRGSGDSITCDWNADGYRLPTEAEWEYAARGGNKDYLQYEYSGGNNADVVAWHGGNSGNSAHPVGTKAANSLGLHDMSGNVWEWCWDWKGDYKPEAQTDPRGHDSGVRRVVRGGSWSDSAERVRSAYRFDYTPSRRNDFIGFRLVRP